MSFSNIKLSRDELYEKVWAQPVSVVAKEYGISDVGLAKMCRRLEVPIPGLGYWAKKQHGKPVEQIPLARLDREVASWHKAQEIRAYVETVRGLGLKKHGRIDPGSEMDQWIKWAMDQADRYDPLVKSPPSVLDEQLPSPYGY
jgi:hypothetical protein